MSTRHPQPKSRDHFTKLFTVVIIALTLGAVPAMSQTNTFPPSGSVGIGTTSPASKLHVQNTAGLTEIAYFVNNDFVYGSVGSGLLFQTGASSGNTYVGIRGISSGAGANNNLALQPTGGNVGIGTTSPASKLHVQGGAGLTEIAYFVNNDFVYGSVGSGLLFQTGASSGNTYVGIRAISSGTAANNNLVLQPTGGNVGIGTATPAAKLDVNGSVNVSGNIAAKYQDVAEWVPATETMEPGTVVVLNPEKSNEVMPATRPYDTTVAGVVSTNPGLILGERAASKAQIATSGRVRVKVNATGRPIRIGDLLVTSGKSGVAMKSEPIEIRGRIFHQPGTIIGKALEPLPSGQGEILVLLSLQ
jgi:hypothetical protein